VADLAGADEVVEGAEGLLEVGPPVEAVDLEQVDPLGVEAPEAVLDRADDVGARLPAVVRAVARVAPWSFVASTTSSRRPASARPSISSDAPLE
jgi:hypothetical protein